MPCRIIVQVMIKNEEKVIEKCLESTLDVADGFCILDTGSTDSTLDVLRKFDGKVSAPMKIKGSQFKNFGENRTESFFEARKLCDEHGWDRKTTFSLLLDADYELKGMISKGEALTRNAAYSMIQKTKTLEYRNTRLIRLDYDWECKGAVHEYWAGPSPTFLEDAWIKDNGFDGDRSSEDKQERYKALLQESVEKDPDNSRDVFYLARTHKALGESDEAYHFFRKRIDMKGYDQEIWISMYELMMIKEEKGDLIGMEYWGQRASELDPERAENLHYMAKRMRCNRKYHKAWQYLSMAPEKKPSHKLFLSSREYDRGLLEEKTVVGFYVGENVMLECIELYDKSSVERPWVAKNARFYLNKPKIRVRRKASYAPDGFSDLSIIKGNGHYIGIIINSDKEVIDGCTFSRPTHTRLFSICLNDRLERSGPMKEIKHNLNDKQLTGVRIGPDHEVKARCIATNGYDTEYYRGNYLEQDIFFHHSDNYYKEEYITSEMPLKIMGRSPLPKMLINSLATNIVHYGSYKYVLSMTRLHNDICYSLIRFNDADMAYTLPFRLDGIVSYITISDRGEMLCFSCNKGKCEILEVDLDDLGEFTKYLSGCH